MKKLVLKIAVVCGLLTAPVYVSAASLSDLFSSLDVNSVVSSVASSVTSSSSSSSSDTSSDNTSALVSTLVNTAVSAVTGTSTTSASSFVGTWNYTNPAMELSSDNTLTNIAANLATSSVETKVQEYLTKIGIEEGIFNYVFNSDGTFSNALKSMTLEGSYTYNSTDNTITFAYKVKQAITVTSLTANVTLSGSNLSLLFDADKLLEFLNSVSTLSDNSTYQSVMAVIANYDSMKLGFDLTKQ